MSNFNVEAGGNNKDNYDRFADANYVNEERHGGRGNRGGRGGFFSDKGVRGGHRERRGGGGYNRNYQVEGAEGADGQEHQEGEGSYRPRRGRGNNNRGGYNRNYQVEGAEGADGQEHQEGEGGYRPRRGRGNNNRGGYNRNYQVEGAEGADGQEHQEGADGHEHQEGEGGYRPRRGRGNNNRGGYNRNYQVEGADGQEHQEGEGGYRPRRGRGNNNRGGYNRNYQVEGADGQEHQEGEGGYRPRRGRGNNNRGGYNRNYQVEAAEGADGQEHQEGEGGYRPRRGRGTYYRGYDGDGGRTQRGGHGDNNDGVEYDRNAPAPDAATKYEPNENELREIEEHYAKNFGGGSSSAGACVSTHATAGPHVHRPDTEKGDRMYEGLAGRIRRLPRQRCNNFDYDEVEALFAKRHNQQGISFDNYESISVDIVPGDVSAVTSFDELEVVPVLLENLMHCGYKIPTPVQKFGIPVAMSGGDLLACAQTGSGKTAAFLIPVVNHILKYGVSPAKDRMSHPIGLIMAPVRELALQIYDETRKLSFKTDIWVDVVYGGVPYSSSFEQDILVACPGRLKDIFERNKISFSRIKFLILDEADRMLEMGFEEQIRYLCNSPASDMPASDKRQTLLFSATFPPGVRDLARSYLRRRHYLLTVGRVGSTTRNITQVVLEVPKFEKDDALMELLEEQSVEDLVLIFVETKTKANEIFNMLRDAEIPCGTIHGDRSQVEREEALRKFKSKERPILVATDVASRGLDIPNVMHVVQYDIPKTMDDYTHRIGRTGRAGNKGVATSFFDPRNDRVLAREMLNYLEEHEQEVPGFIRMVVEDIAEEKFSSGPKGRRNGGGSSANDTGGVSRGAAPPRTRVREIIAEYDDGGM